MGARASRSSATPSAPAATVPEFAQRMLSNPSFKNSIIVDPAFQLAVQASWQGGRVTPQQYSIIRQGLVKFSIEQDENIINEAITAALSPSAPAHASPSSPSSFASATASGSVDVDQRVAAIQAEAARQLAAQKQHFAELTQQAYHKGASETAAAYEIKMKQTLEAAELGKELDLHDKEQMRLAALQSAIERMKVPVTSKPTLAPLACAGAREAVQQCFRTSAQNKTDPLVCQALTQAFIECTKNSIALAIAK